MIAKYQNLAIEITDESNSDSTKFGQKFKNQYPSDLGIELEFQPSSKHGIRITENGIEKCSAILMESGGATGIFEKSFLIKNDRIYICCSDQVYSLNITDLSVNWRNSYDWATCFGIYEFQNDFLIHGETLISRIDDKGNKIWSFGAKDVFVNPEGKEEFKIYGNRIELTDFEGNKYVLNADGIET